MKITKKVELEIKELMNDYWDSYFRGDIRHWATYLTEDYRNIGGTEEEIWNSKKEIVDYTDRVIDQMAGSSEIRNKQLQIIPYTPYFMVHELLDIYLKVGGEWTFYQKFRLSSLIQKMSDGWKVLHQHGSYPDSKTQEGEAFAFDTIKNENLRLKEAIKSRTKELEGKNRELEIEAALERVRSRSMAMHKSNEVLDVADTLYDVLKQLDFPFGACTIIIMDKDSGDMEHWVAGFNHTTYPESYSVKYFNHPLYEAQLSAWKNGETYLVLELAGDAKRSYDEVMFTQTGYKDFPEEEKKWMKQVDSVIFSIAYMSHGALMWGPGKLTDEYAQLLQRFVKVFEQTYTRFLDLQKAEEQARTSQIELAVERVRAKALAMNNSTQIMDVVATLRNEMLGLEILGVVAATIYLKEENDYIRMWDLSSVIIMEDGFQVALDVKFKLSETDPDLFIRRVWNNTENYFVEKQDAHDMVITLEWLRQYYPEQADEGQQFFDTAPWKYVLHPTIQLAHGKMSVDILDAQPPAEMESIMIKMGATFDLAYKRFLDLQRSEAQIREGQIELALERVRARTMAMQHSNELLDAATLLFQQIESLGAPTWNVSFNIWTDDKKQAIAWNGTKDGFGRPFNTPTNENVFLEFYNASQHENDFFEKEIGGKDLELHYEFLATLPGVSITLNELKQAGIALPTSQVFNIAYFTQGYLMFITYDKLPEFKDIFKRFAKVFEQTYTRFLDLEKAEAQATEVQIELSLERVRAKTMAMHNSTDVANTVAVMFDELIHLGIEKSARCGIGILEENSMTMEVWTAYSKPNQNVGLAIGTLDMTSHTMLQQVYSSWKNNELHSSYTLEGEDEKKYYQAFNKMADYSAKFDVTTLPVVQYQNAFYFKEGIIYIFTLEQLTNKRIDIFKRFANVFGQTYTRYLDLQRAEAQAREARIESGLEKVRSRTLAMQSSDELAETSVVVFKQLINLGIEPNRLFIGIIKEKTGDIEAWATNEDGTKIGNHFTLNIDKNESVKKMCDGWKQKKTSITIDMKGSELQNYFHYLASEMQIPFKDGLSQKRRVQTIAYFGQGLIGMASPEEQPEESIHLLERFAAVFNLTYTRFNDLKIAEAHAIQAEEDLIKLQTEKRRAEEALDELKETQKQLIQSEKMASLGELTAGIAHEIQNPLNFVNNFSEVSNELIEEMRDEFKKGDMDEGFAIVDDIKQNLEKINFHGKRADAIVKGMLEHSRTSSGAKEPTDINKLADEYLRLAYHGLRAKDKSFNATMKTDYGDNIGAINVISQDLGRVILNLITNAFYVVDEKKKQIGDGYEPTVSVSTKKMGNTVLVSIEDNGNGIPQNIVNKIFQPFFTTKPTGQGTGLGLSLSYDIVKAHNGELKVATKEGEGTIFSIHLPI